MLDWRIEIDHDWSLKPGWFGRGLKQLLPAETWSDADRLRGLLGYWGMLIGPAIGVAIAGLRPVSRPSPR